MILAVGPASAAEVAGVPTADDYAAAARLLETNLVGKVKNETVVPHWLDDGLRFWYRRDADAGHEYVIVDIRTGKKTLAFDHAALATALSAVLEEAVTADGLGLTGESLDGNLATLKATAQGKSVACDLPTMECAATPLEPPRPDLLVSPGGTWGVTTRDDNLLLIEMATGKERQLTDDGQTWFSYGKLPDTSLMIIPLKKSGRKLPPFGASFSPDERYLIVPRIDERDVAVNPFVEWVPSDGLLRPVYHSVRTPFTGDRGRAKTDLFVFDTSTGESRRILPPAGYEDGLGANVQGWSMARGQAFLLASTIGAKKLALVRVELATGESSVLIEDTSETRVETNTNAYNRPNVRIIDDGAEVIWYSDRTGWGHLYRYDGQSGELKNAITAGTWVVQDIHHLDERNGIVYFTAGGREPGRDPYYRFLYKAPLDGSSITLLTDGNADHHFAPEMPPFVRLVFGIPPAARMIRPDLGVLVDTYSTVSEPPVTVLRRTADGRAVAVLERADASALYAAGWRPPVRQAVKAADGETDVYTVYWAPQKALPDGKHPVIDAVYGGPQIIVAPRNFSEAYGATYPYGQAAEARLGFAVVTTDGRGTPMRSSAFRDAGYVEFTRIGIEDHVAAIEQLAERYPEMDVRRVGIHGWSWGGTFSAQAILQRPDFYDVCVTGAGVYDYALMYPGFEGAVGVPVYTDGSPYRTEPGEKPSNLGSLDITKMAGRLEGKLLIVYGDLDENVPPSQAFRFIDALIRENKAYDLLYIPGGTHATAHPGASVYSLQRRFDYLVEHLLGAEPPADAVITYGPP
jgi:dipeptidyl aminopeptidase/acylaminoacyl peptidase